MQMSQQPRYQQIIGVILTLFVFAAAMTFFRVREYTDKSIDLQILIKLAAIGVSLIVPVGAIISGRMKIDNKVQIAWLLFLMSFVATSLWSPNPTISFLDSVAFVGCLLFSIWVVSRFEEVLVSNILVMTVGAVAVISLIVYFVNPELGRMHAWLGDEFGMNNRIRGIAGSPNGLGSMTSIALILTMLYYTRTSSRLRPLLLAGAPFAAVCLVMSDNRTALAMLALAPLAMVTRKGNRAFNLLLIGLAGCLVLTVLATAPDLLLDSLSRTGESDEITSGNGRSVIWSVVTQMIAEKPFIGHGYASATFILPEDPRLFSVAAHTHNLYLEVLFSGGLMSFLLFLGALAVTAFEAVRNKAFEPLLILVFFLFRGLTEPAPFGGTPTFAGYAFFLCIAFIAARSQSRAYGSRSAALVSTQRVLARCRGNLQRAA